MDKKYTTTNYKQTQKLGENLAKEILSAQRNPTKALRGILTGPSKSRRRRVWSGQAVVLSLQGNLGGGKTTFLQGFAEGLAIKEKILSPTFVVQKRFKLKGQRFENFYHIDCYRIKDHKDILELGFEKIISDPKNIVAIEWPEKIKKVLPRKRITISFKFIGKNQREIKIS